MKVALKIEGIHCAGCVNAIQNYLLDIDGIKSCEVNLATNKAIIEYDPTKIDLKIIESAIEETGYKVRYEKILLRIKDLTEIDVRIIEDKLGHEGIRNISVNHVFSSVYIEYNPMLLSIAEIRSKLESLGYKILSEELILEDNKDKKNKLLIIIGAILTFPVMIYSYNEYIPFSLPFLDISSYIMFGLSSIIQVLLGSKFYLGTYRIARLKKANMDTLIALGTTAAYLYSTYNTFTGSNALYYDASTAILTLVLLGKYIEDKMKGRASNIIRKLLELQPKNALVLRSNKYEKVPVDLLNVNDLIIVKPGERVPIDGTIVEGSTTIDESMITGESIPVNKFVGDNVIGGTINKDGVIIIKVSKSLNETVLAGIVKLVEESISKKPMLQRLVDKISGYFAFFAIGISIITFIIWYSLTHDPSYAIIPAVTVLVVACPCALGLATPTAIMVGLSKSAQHGVIFKSGEAIETLSKIDIMVFDKTGTLTEGKLNVTDIIPVKDNMLSSNLLLEIAASVESQSEHPIAKAIVRKAESLGLKLKNVEKVRVLPGMGVKAVINNNTILVGSVNFITREADISKYDNIIKRLQSEGKTVIVIAVNKEAIGILGLLDTAREEAKDLIDKLKREGVRCIMLTGDNKITAEKIARDLAIEEVKAEITPDMKVNIIKELKQGHKVCMIGDGINDAPALVEADVGIAISNASDITIEAADIIIIKNDLYTILYAYKMGKKIMDKIKHNLFYAFIYNTILIPLAAFGLVYPALAGLAMALSSVSVTTSSLLLKRFKL